MARDGCESGLPDSLVVNLIQMGAPKAGCSDQLSDLVGSPEHLQILLPAVADFHWNPLADKVVEEPPHCPEVCPV